MYINYVKKRIYLYFSLEMACSCYIVPKKRNLQANIIYVLGKIIIYNKILYLNHYTV